MLRARLTFKMYIVCREMAWWKCCMFHTLTHYTVHSVRWKKTKYSSQQQQQQQQRRLHAQTLWFICRKYTHKYPTSRMLLCVDENCARSHGVRQTHREYCSCHRFRTVRWWIWTITGLAREQQRERGSKTKNDTFFHKHWHSRELKLLLCFARYLYDLNTFSIAM